MNLHGCSQPHSNEGGALLGSWAFATPSTRGDADTVALAYPTQDPSGHPEHQAAFLEPGDVWKEFQVHRSSAEYHLDNYLDYLARSSEGFDPIPLASQDLSDSTQSDRKRTQIQMKISRDTAIRDLLAMETILAHAKNFRKSQKPAYSPMAAMWTATCSLFALAIPSKVAAGIFAAGAVVGAVVLASPPVWHYYQDHKLDVVRARVQTLRRAFQSDIGAVNDASRDVLKDSHYKFLRLMFADS